MADDAIRCDACPVLCYIKPGRTGSCDRYGNHEGKLVRLDPHIVLDRALERGESVVPFLERGRDWDGRENWQQLPGSVQILHLAPVGLPGPPVRRLARR